MSEVSLLGGRRQFLKTLTAAAVATPVLGALGVARPAQACESRAEEIVRSSLEGFNNRNVDQVVRYWDPKVLYQNTGQPDINGVAASRAFIAPFFVIFSSIHYYVLNTALVGRMVATERLEHYVVSPTSPVGNPGSTLALRVSGWVEVSGDKIVRWSDYYNAADVTTATGIPF
jgi:limonene-1,2-epoxide hydrolase